MRCTTLYLTLSTALILTGCDIFGSSDSDRMSSEDNQPEKTVVTFTLDRSSKSNISTEPDSAVVRIWQSGGGGNSPFKKIVGYPSSGEQKEVNIIIGEDEISSFPPMKAGVMVLKGGSFEGYTDKVLTGYGETEEFSISKGETVQVNPEVTVPKVTLDRDGPFSYGSRTVDISFNINPASIAGTPRNIDLGDFGVRRGTNSNFNYYDINNLEDEVELIRLNPYDDSIEGTLRLNTSSFEQRKSYLKFGIDIDWRYSWAPEDNVRSLKVFSPSRKQKSIPIQVEFPED